MKRVVMFTPGLTEPGGAARRSRLLASELARRGWDVRVVTRAGTLRRFSTTRTAGLITVEVPGFHAPRLGAVLFLLVAVTLGISWGFRARAFVAVQITSQTTAAAVCGLVLRKPFVAFLTTGGSISEVGYVLGRRTAGIRRWLLSRARALIAQTDHAREDLASSFPQARVVVAANPVMLVGVAPLNGEPKALFTGRFSEEKDLGRLLDCWRSIAAADEAARLTLLGEGGAYRSVEAELRSKIEGDDVLARSVELPGWVADVQPYLVSNDVYVFPSLSEGMSNSLLEACAAERVVVASDIPPNRAVVGDGHPLLFKAGDSDDLSRCLQAALYDADVRRLAIAHVRARLPLFSIEGFVNEIEALLEE